MEVMGFDFYAAEANMAPALAEVTARFTEAGVWNSVAFWFQLQLDEETSLDTSPYCDKVQHDVHHTQRLQGCSTRQRALCILCATHQRMHAAGEWACPQCSDSP